MRKQEILLATNGGLDIYQYVLNRMNVNVQLKGARDSRIKNPFYEDSNPSLSIYYSDQSQEYLFKDFGNDEYKGDAFTFFGHYARLDPKSQFSELLGRISSDILNTTLEINKPSSRMKTQHKKAKRNFTSLEETPQMKVSTDYSYWRKLFPNSISLEEKAKIFGLIPIQWIKHGKLNWNSTKLGNIFAFQVGKHSFKLYNPESSNKMKFMWINKPENIHEHFISLVKPGQPVLICEGYKDAFSVFLHGLNAIPHDNAAIDVNQAMIQQLIDMRCTPIICFDNDEAGMKAQVKASAAFHLPSLHIPKKVNESDVNDLTDYLSASGSAKSLEAEIADIHQQFRETDHRFRNIFLSRDLIIQNASQPVKKDDPLLTLNGNPIIYPETLSIIQGASGTHKSRMCEAIVSALIQKEGNEVSGVQRKEGLKPIRVIYTDTERNQKFQFPFALQQMRENGGYDRFKHISLLEPLSLINVKRNERMTFLRNHLERFAMESKGPVVIVIDILTDCASNFNEVGDTMELTDLMNEMINQYAATIIGVIHSNPGSNKARGHIGTEVTNKASYMASMNLSDNLIEMKCLKNRNDRPHSNETYAFDEDSKLLRTANEAERLERKKKGNINKVLDLLESHEPNVDHRTKDLLKKIMNICECAERTAENLLKTISEDAIPVDIDGIVHILTRKRGSVKLIPKVDVTQISLDRA
ncbi:toprim domain-containing protein [Sanyastnella coralliicola]|uniref:toprim domain-containing protein n=1 Tax=Sanyastnella coralliicola TaxID=3069118 RepID=UPI0027BAE236|nr:AAA family ATPase [Longitalea sp. SCSIO 12813]